MKSCVIRACYAQDIGGALMIESGTVKAENLTISGCYTEENEGGAVYLNGGTLQITDGGIKSCIAKEASGGALYIESGILQCEHINFEHNMTEDNGGAVYLDNSGGCLFLGCTFLDNHADDYGGGIYFNQDAPDQKCRIMSCAFSRNSTDGNGGAMYVNANYVYMQDVEMTDNHAGSGKSGGAVYLDDDYVLGIQGKMIIQKNTAGSKIDNLFVPKGAKLTNGGLLEGSLVRLTPNSATFYQVFDDISKIQGEYIKVDNGRAAFSNEHKRIERFASSVIEQGNYIMVLIGIAVLIIAIVIIVIFNKKKQKSATPKI